MVARVLVVEDDNAIRNVVQEVLADSGHEVTTAADGALGLAMLDAQGPYDLVLLDMLLPMVDGWEFARQMRERGKDVPLLIMTAVRDPGQAANEVRAVGYVRKPFDIEVLERAVRDALSGHTVPLGERGVSELVE